jgi:hypothetical protein
MGGTSGKSFEVPFSPVTGTCTPVKAALGVKANKHFTAQCSISKETSLLESQPKYTKLKGEKDEVFRQPFPICTSREFRYFSTLCHFLVPRGVFCGKQEISIFSTLVEQQIWKKEHIHIFRSAFPLPL